MHRPAVIALAAMSVGSRSKMTLESLLINPIIRESSIDKVSAIPEI
jgi:hypothetical protein